LPDGEAKENMRNKLRRLNDRKENIEERISKSGNMGLLMMEMRQYFINKTKKTVKHG